MRQLSASERVERMLPFLERAGLISLPATDEQRRTVEMLDAACGDRLKLLSDIVRYGRFAFANELDYDKKSLKTLSKEGANEQLQELHSALQRLQNFTAEEIEKTVKEVAEKLGVGGKINHVLRAATTGRSVGPGVYDCLVILGQQRSLQNIAATREGLEKGTLQPAKDEA